MFKAMRLSLGAVQVIVLLIGVTGAWNLQSRSDAVDGAPLVSPIKVDHMHPTIRKDAKRIRLYYGPYQIYGQNEPRGNASKGMDPAGVSISQTIIGFCSNCTVLSAKTDTHYMNGTRASVATGIYDHHILILDPGKQTLPWWLCDGQSGLGNTTSAGFMVAGVDESANLYHTHRPRSSGGGAESADSLSHFDSGYFIPDSSRKFSLNAELINYRDTAQEVFITAETEFIEGKQPQWRDASMSLMSVTGCQSPDYRPPHGERKFNMTGPTFRMPKSGHIISGKGHIHDGGLSISLSVNNMTVCDSIARYGGDGSTGLGPDGKPWSTIHEMSQCNEPVPVKKGDILSVKSVYDADLHPLRKSADGHGEGEEMGTFFINFAAAPS